VRKPEIQERLRSELAEFPGDPSVDELMDPTALPYLDALVHEALRLHPAIMETPRKAVKDDVLPLATPVTLPDGTRADRLPIAKGTVVVAPIAAANRMVSVWGPDAHEFKPERWLDGGVRIPAAVKAFPGHRHMLTFLDGPKKCVTDRSYAPRSEDSDGLAVVWARRSRSRRSRQYSSCS
jgi:cytochrome P450